MEGPTDERSKKKEDQDDLMINEDSKAESESIHTMEEVDGKLFADWQEYSRKKPKKRMGTEKADSEASNATNFSISTLASRIALEEEEERETWGGKYFINLHYLHDVWSFFQVRLHPLHDWECCGPGERVEVSLLVLQERWLCLPPPLLHLHVRHRHLWTPHREHNGPVLRHGHSSCFLQVGKGKLNCFDSSLPAASPSSRASASPTCSTRFG